MSGKKPSIVIQQLVLVGRRKNYVVPFSDGLNIVYGDSATGKSSVLECINYLFGSSKLIYDREIESSVLYVMMEVHLNEVPYVIKRDIFDVNADIEIYPSELQSLSGVFPQKYAPSFAREGRDGYFSDFILAALNVPNIKMKQAPTKDESPMVRLSFRDLFKFCYLKQDDVGSKGLLGDGGYAAVKNKETFKYIFNLLDTNISDLQEEFSAVKLRGKQLDAKYKTVSDFLRATDFKTETDLEDAQRELDSKRQTATVELNRIKDTVTASNESYSILRDALRNFVARISLLEKDILESDSAIERYVRLKNDYQQDIQKLKSIRTSEKLIGDPREKFSCPLCDSEVHIDIIRHEHSIKDDDRLAQELSTLTRRIRDIDSLIQKERSKQILISNEMKSLQVDRDNARRMLDEEMHSMMSPYLTERDAWSYELARIEEQKKSIEYELRIRNQQKLIFKELLTAHENADVLQERLNALIAKAPALKEVLTDLGDMLSGYLRDVRIADLRDVSISERTFLPVLRNRDYRDITSGGLRTILSIGHFLGILNASLSPSVNFPSFLMIDTVGKYLGKTHQRYTETDIAADAREGVSDPTKYLNMYKAMLALAAKAKREGVAAQIIVVDNDIPPDVYESNPDAVSAFFNSVGNEGALRGLIDDAHLQ